MREPVTPDRLRIVGANQAAWDDLQAVFGDGGPARTCQCQRYKLEPGESFGSAPVEERQLRLRLQAGCDDPGATSTSGLVAYLDDEPVGWCAVEPRPDYPGLVRVYRIPWEGREAEDRGDPEVWAITCLFTRAGYRRRGISYALAGAAVEFARQHGARAVEAYPIITREGRMMTVDEIHVGTPQVFRRAGLTEVARPGRRRVVMRRELR